MIAALDQSRPLRFFAFLALYFAQGVPWGFVGVGFPVIMTDQGLSNLDIAAATASMYTPWTFKVLFGPVLDALPIARLGLGRRRPFIILAELGMAGTLLWLVTVTDIKAHLALVAGLLFAHNVCAALQDVAVDALAVDVLKADERARANSLMWAAKVGGVAVGGGGGVFLAKYAGWPNVMLTMALIVLIVMLVPILVREYADQAGAAFVEARLPTREELKASFSFQAPLVGFLIAFFGPFGYAMVPSITIRALRGEFQYTEEMLGVLNGIVEPLSGVAGALCGGVLGDRFGVKRCMVLGSCVMGFMLALFGLTKSHWGNLTYMIAWDVVYFFALYMYSAVSLGLFMTLSNPRIGATHFALYMATTNLCYIACTYLGGVLADSLGYQTTFLIAGAAQVLGLAPLPFCRPEQAEARFHAQA